MRSSEYVTEALK